MATNFQFDHASHRYSRDGVPVLSVTQILAEAGLVNFDMVKPEVLERAQQLGRLVHQACHYFDADALQPEETLPEEVAIRLRAYKKFRRQSGYVPTKNEVQQIGKSGLMEYGMQYDSTGFVGAVPWLVDIKNGGFSLGWEIQVAFYELGIGRPLPHLHFNRVVVQLRDDETYRCHQFKDPAAFDVARAAYVVGVKPDWATFKQYREAGNIIAAWKSNHGKAN